MSGSCRCANHPAIAPPRSPPPPPCIAAYSPVAPAARGRPARAQAAGCGCAWCALPPSRWLHPPRAPNESPAALGTLLQGEGGEGASCQRNILSAARAGQTHPPSRVVTTLSGQSPAMQQPPPQQQQQQQQQPGAWPPASPTRAAQAALHAAEAHLAAGSPAMALQVCMCVWVGGGGLGALRARAATAPRRRPHRRRRRSCCVRCKHWGAATTPFPR